VYPAFPEEEAGVAEAPERRLREFRGGRAVARQVLDRLGVEPGPIPMDGRRPVWPQGIVGSIAHTKGFTVAAASPLAPRPAGAGAAGVRGIGIDVERTEAVSERLFRRILTEEERDWVAVAGHPEFWGTVLFSAKEAFYKGLSGIHDEFVGFQDVRLELEPQAATFQVTPIADVVRAALAGLEVRGRYCRHAEWIVTGVTVHPAGGPRN
jgi:4'-phosphopantetheinyl transferase EntD